MKAAIASNCLLADSHVDLGTLTPAASHVGSAPVAYACTNNTAATIHPQAPVVQLRGRSDPSRSLEVVLSEPRVTGVGGPAVTQLVAVAHLPKGAAPDTYEGSASLTIAPDENPAGAQQAEVRITAVVG